MFICVIKDLGCNLTLRSNKQRRHLLYWTILFSFWILTLFSAVGQAQFFEYGQDRGLIRWYHFSSEHYRLIYPEGLDSLAMDFADKLEYYYPHQAEIMDHGHKKMPVIIHNESSFSNGVFVWAPKRLEVFTNPDPNGYPQDWMTQLALHEGRHAMQVSKLNQGLSRGLSFIAGEQAVGGITGMLPIWYLEGDAVDAETRLSYTGRGRLPSFEMGTKAILLENGGRYGLSKALLGSYKDYIPNHYELGYLLVRYGRRTYGDEFWNDMVDLTARKPFLIAPSYFSMRKYGVKSKNELYQAALDLYQNHWNISFEKRKPDSVKNWSSIPESMYTSYSFPQWLNDSVIIALKTGIDQIPEFVRINADGEENRIFRPGALNSGRFSASADVIVWDEWVPDIRWSNRNFSVIRMFDLASGKVKNLGSSTRYYAPAISKSGKRIAVVEQGTDHKFKLVILNIDGEPVHIAESPDNLFIQHPHWMEQDTALLTVVNTDTGKYLYQYSLVEYKWSRIFHAGYNDISWPMTGNGGIYFNSSFSGIDNIYRYQRETGTFYRVTNASFGAFYPDIKRGMILYSDYHSDGYRAVSKPLDTDEEMQLEIPFNASFLFDEQIDAEPTSEEREIIEGSKNLPQGDYTPKRYYKLAHAVNIHSWLPLWFDYMNPEAALTPKKLPVAPGFTLLSQNLLSTVTGAVGYEYREGMHMLHSGVRLKGRFPVFDISLQYGGMPRVYRIDDSDNPPVQPNRLAFVANTYVPVRLNTGKYISYIQPLLSYSYTSDLFPNESLSAYETGTHRLFYSMYASSYLRLGSRDILPRIGFSVRAGYGHAPWNTHNFGNQRFLTTTLYLPGLLQHQSLKLTLSTESQDPERYLFGSQISLPRGYGDINGLGMRMVAVDYHFPMAYPDLNIGPVLYIKRVRGNLWGDYLQGKSILVSKPEPSIQDKNYYSFGTDLLFDLHVLRFLFPFSMGARIAFLPVTGEWKPEFLFTIDID